MTTSKLDTKIELHSKKENLGKILPESGSIKTKEFRGMLLPSKAYFENRALIRKFFSTLKNQKKENWLDKLLDKFSGKKSLIYKDFYELGLYIRSGEEILTNDSSFVIISDKLRHTSKGNWVIQIDILNMIIPQGFPEFDLYKVEWKYPAPPDGILAIKKGKEIVMEY
ncbi:MAG: hypothetical protein AAGI23_14870 [Bacteroidota bacterium]